MLLVVAGGYWFTVRPVFQLQRLSEDHAKLQLERNRWQDQVADLRAEVSQSKAELAGLIQEKQKLQGSIAELSNQYELAQQELAESHKERIQAEKSLANINQALKETESTLYEQRKLELTGEGKLPKAVGDALRNVGNIFDIFSPDRADSIAEALRSEFVQPIDIAVKKVQEYERDLPELSKNTSNKVEKRILDNLRSGLAQHESALTCPTPDFLKWQESFQSALTNAESKIENCAKGHERNRIADAGWSEGQFKVIQDSDEWSKQLRYYERVCRIHVHFIITQAFINAWNTGIDPCKHRILRLNKILLSEVDVTELQPPLEMRPPDLFQLSEEIDLATANWLDQPQH